jgi:hypothetical protein
MGVASIYREKPHQYHFEDCVYHRLRHQFHQPGEVASLEGAVGILSSFVDVVVLQLNILLFWRISCELHKHGMKDDCHEMIRSNRWPAMMLPCSLVVDIVRLIMLSLSTSVAR